ncbi:MAG: 30S ribosomal protein S21 [Flavobacteriales bacterium]|jgi:small subunit ribosomal protein S21|nr:30S ribosomal protein S21 [Flavobacteriales bacterium]|tara:strand:+ start:1359 stop:1547 length:189 start_codon:yes stop_codon:yes gene_type:complete
MLQIPVKEGESIERALKKYKKKFERTGVLKQLRARKQYIKKSVTRRQEVIKAEYVEKLKFGE